MLASKTWPERFRNLWLPSLQTILVVAAVLRLCSIFALRNFLRPQTWEFGPLARSLAAGQGYSEVLKNGTRVPAIYMPPAYSYFLAFFYRLLGDKPAAYFAVETIQAGLGVLLVYVVYRLAQLLIGQRGAIGAACLTAIYPTQVYMCNEFHGISIYIVLGTATIFFLTRYLQVTLSWTDLAAAALCMGGVMLFRGEAPALAFLYAVILVWRGGRAKFIPAVAFLAISYVCLLPWMIRNYRDFHKVIPVCASGGENLWIGNNPRATGSQHYSLFDPMSPEVKSAFDRIQPGPYMRIQKDKALGRIALTYMSSHPLGEVRLAFRKLWIFFVLDPAHEKGRSFVYWLPSITLTGLAIWGARLRGWQLLLVDDVFLISSILFTVAVSTLVFVLPRYKIAIDPLLMIIAGNVVVDQQGSSLHGDSRELFAPGSSRPVEHTYI